MPPIAIPFIILGAIGLIILAVLLIKRRFRHLNIQNPDADKPKNEKEIIEQNLNRILVPMDEDKNKQKDTKDETQNSSNPKP